MAEYRAPYRIAQRQITDMDEDNRAVGEVVVVPTDSEDWSATVQYSLEGANLNFTRITLHPAGDNITSTIWKRFPIGDIRRYLRETFKEHPEWMSAGAMQNVEEQERRVQEAAEVLRKNKPQIGRKRKLNDENWRAITDVYLYCVRTGGTKSIYKRMAQELRERFELDEKEETMKWQTERAREYGFLTRPGKGNVGGEEGPRYWESLKEEE